jgi:RNA recognition motif-containing protein
MKLIIRNLDRSITEAEIKTIFEEFGTVQSCDLVMDKALGVSKGFCFVQMPKAGQAKVAMKAINNKSIGSSKVRVKRAEYRPP